MSKTYYRPLVQLGATRPGDALPLAGGWAWFTHAEKLTRDGSLGIVSATDIPAMMLQALTRPRADVAGLSMDAVRIMAILNVTPDSFSDGGKFAKLDTAVAGVRAMVSAGADILDIGGESTRPGADFVPIEQEIARVIPVIEEVAPQVNVPISLDTRKAEVAKAGLAAGAKILNDVSALSYDADMKKVVAGSGLPVCLMHAQGDPKTMQDDPLYGNVLLDVYDYLEERIAFAVSGGIRRDRLIIDPGIGFGKTLEHNLTILRNISIFHGLGVPILLGVSRKRFIGSIGGASEAQDRMPGSIAVALAGYAQGVQIVRVHDMAETKQAFDLFSEVAVRGQTA